MGVLLITRPSRKAFRVPRAGQLIRAAEQRLAVRPGELVEPRAPLHVTAARPLAAIGVGAEIVNRGTTPVALPLRRLRMRERDVERRHGDPPQPVTFEDDTASQPAGLCPML
jgi:hypothetical protein